MEKLMKLPINTLFLLILPLCFTGCAILEPLFQHEDEGANFDNQATYVESGEPKIVPGLILRIGVTASGNAAVEESLKEVNANGEILMPLVGAIKCEGKTLIELESEIKEKFKEFFLEPQVSCGFAYTENSGLKSPWGTVLLMGSVARPGPVNMPSTRDLTVTRALMMGGNALPVADTGRVRVTRREKDGSLKRFMVDIDKIGQDGRVDLDIKLKPGDVIWVPESWY